MQMVPGLYLEHSPQTPASGRRLNLISTLATSARAVSVYRTNFSTVVCDCHCSAVAKQRWSTGTIYYNLMKAEGVKNHRDPSNKAQVGAVEIIWRRLGNASPFRWIKLDLLINSCPSLRRRTERNLRLFIWEIFQYLYCFCPW